MANNLLLKALDTKNINMNKTGKTGFLSLESLVLALNMKCFITKYAKC